MKSSFLVVLALLCGNALCVKYQADVTITGDKYMPNAEIRAKLYYQRENNKHVAFFQYTDFDMSEFIDYTASKRLIYCTECESETISSVDKLDLSSAKRQSDTENGCTKYTREGESVKEIWAKGSTEDAEICKVVFTDGKIYKYSNFGRNPPTKYLAENSTWKCPQPICTKSVDVVLVLDRSGSIIWSEWTEMVSFAKSVIDSFDPSTARFGISTFTGTGAKGIELTDSVLSVKNKLDSYGTPSGTTCIGCGIKIADEYFKDARPDATKIMVVFSDGGDCSGKREGNAEHYKTASENAKKNNITIVAVGVGNGISNYEMETIASENSTGGDLYIKAKGFSDLKNILTPLVKETCSAAPDTYKSCGPDCGGFCTCNQKCVCPTCEKGDKCTSYKCTSANAGCKVVVTQCPTDQCHNTVCNPSSGCVNTSIDCSYMATKPCHDYGCNPSSGCTVSVNPSKCPSRPCHSVKCTMANGCEYTPLCQERNCQILSCVENKCNYTPRPCEQKDTMCTVWKCNPVTNSCVSEDIEYPVRPCYNMTCDDATGPVYTPYKCPEDSTEPLKKCEQRYCDTSDDRCKVATINPEICDVCDGIDCDNSTNKCEKGKCVKDGNEAKCIYEPTVTCVSSCATGLVCNPATGNCDKTSSFKDQCEESTKDNECMKSKCDIETGQCKNTTTECNDRLPCFIGTCKPGSTKCEYEAVCGKSNAPCVDLVCDPENVDGNICVLKNRTCELDADTDFNPECETMVCNVKTDKCEVDSSKCDPCKGVICDDGDPCHIGACVVEDGLAKCKYTEKCSEGDDYCNPIKCNIFGECVARPRSCAHVDVSGKEQSCYKVECIKSAGECRKVVIEGAFTDVCGRCIQSFGDNETELKEKLEDTTCIGALKAEEFAAALTGAAIAGIIIACVVVAAIIATAGYFGTKELIRRAKMAQDQSANNNPLYEGNANEMTNPSYAGAE